MKVQYKRPPLWKGWGSVLLVSLAVSSRKHFCHWGGHTIQVSVCLWLWQPRFSINHSVTSKVNLAGLKYRYVYSCVLFSTMNIKTSLSQVSWEGWFRMQQQAIRLPPRYRPIWTIFIMFESPWLRNARFDSKCWRYVVPRGATLCQLVFYMGITSWEPRHTRKTIWLKILPNLFFYQFISELFASRSTLCHLLMTQRSWENLDCIKF